MGSLRNWLRRLERNGSETEISILQQDGTVSRFPAEATAEAFSWEAERMMAIHRGADPGPAHPLTVAKRNSMHPETFGNVFDADKQPRSRCKLH